jgi:cell division protein FtsB
VTAASPGRGRPRPTSAAKRARRTGERPARPAPARTLRGYARAHTASLTLTTRAALLGLAICAVVLTLVYPAREYFAQRRQISDLQQQVAADKQNITDAQLANKLERDPKYIEDQARERLNMVMPGDQVFQLRPTPVPKAGKQKAGAVQTPELLGRNAQSWYSQLYRSVVESGK